MAPPQGIYDMLTSAGYSPVQQGDDVVIPADQAQSLDLSAPPTAPAAPAAPTSPYAAIIQQQQANADKAHADAKTALDSLYNDKDLPGMSPEDSVATAILSAIPIALGAAHGLQ